MHFLAATRWTVHALCSGDDAEEGIDEAVRRDARRLFGGCRGRGPAAGPARSPPYRRLVVQILRFAPSGLPPSPTFPPRSKTMQKTKLSNNKLEVSAVRRGCMGLSFAYCPAM